MPHLLAHGLLGNFDEIIYLGIGIAFVGFMGLSWVRSRNQVFDDETPEQSSPDDDSPIADDSPDHFNLG